jgi:DNA ligase-1
MELQKRCETIQKLFDQMDGEQASNWQKELVAEFRRSHPELNKDLDFCFEVLAGKHKMGVTVYYSDPKDSLPFERLWRGSIEDFYLTAKNAFDEVGRTLENIDQFSGVLKKMGISGFFVPLINRTYRLGYSNKQAMITDKSPMLAKKWDEERFRFKGKRIHIQEKYDGNRCVAWKENGEWHFQSRRGKPLKVNFDMESFAGDTNLVFDGEVLTKRGDFNKASGLISSLDKNKDELIYMIYDIIHPDYNYNNRRIILEEFKDTEKVKVAPIIREGIYVGSKEPNIGELNEEDIGRLLLEMVNQGAEGIIVRIGDGLYENKRSLNLLKYKLVQTMDMKCTGWIPGTGKYEGMIGALTAELTTDKGEHITASIGSGLSDLDRDKDPDYFIGKILEVQYFEKSKNQSSDENEWSLRFPRLKGVRNDRTTTSEY